jgi:tetratricopeptide (TPR) repeat protein
MKHGVDTASKGESNAQYKKAMDQFEATNYQEANSTLSQLLEHTERYSVDQLEQIKTKKLICMIKLGLTDEISPQYHADMFSEKGVWSIMIANCKYVDRYRETKRENYNSYTDADIKQEDISDTMQNVELVKSIDNKFHFDTTYAQAIYYFLAWQLYYFRQYADAVELLNRALMQREPRSFGKWFNSSMKEMPTFKLYDLMGDSYYLLGKNEKARESYSKALNINPELQHIQIKLDSLKQ